MAKKQFKAESKRLLDLMINSIYTNKEIFLRELISNASDALDKLSYLSLTDASIGMDRSDFCITISADDNLRTLTLSDNGIGMSREDLENNLGVIARSGSLQFKNDMSDSEKSGDIDIIGQFGVGFYSSFMVAKNVKVISRAYGTDEAYAWTSDGADGYSIAEFAKESTGTDIIITLKDDEDGEEYGRFLQQHTIERLVKTYSDYIRYPIKMEREKFNTDKDAPKETEIVTMNSMIPIWQRKKSELTDDDYASFYSEQFYDYEKPLAWTHVDAEGVVSYKALLYIPAKASFDYYTREYKKGLRLYSSGVMIMDKCEDLLPEHFRFIRGVIDTPDLSLNISREMLQQNRELKTIAANLEKKIKAELLSMLNDNREKYDVFYKSFGIQLKYGVTNEYGKNKALLSDLLLFPSSDSDVTTTLADYVSRMKEEQKYIYFATGDSVKKINALPQTELVKDKGYEILYFIEEVDEFVSQILHEFDGKEFRSVNSDDAELISEEEKKSIEEKNETHKPLLDFVKEALGERVKEVKISEKLKNHAACLTAAGGLSFEMEKYLKSMQPEKDMQADRVLELNAEHKIFSRLNALYSIDEDRAKKYAEVLYNQSACMAGIETDDASAYSEMLFDLLS